MSPQHKNSLIKIQITSIFSLPKALKSYKRLKSDLLYKKSMSSNENKSNKKIVIKRQFHLGWFLKIFNFKLAIILTT